MYTAKCKQDDFENFYRIALKENNYKVNTYLNNVWNHKTI